MCLALATILFILSALVLVEHYSNERKALKRLEDEILSRKLKDREQARIRGEISFERIEKYGSIQSQRPEQDNI